MQELIASWKALNGGGLFSAVGPARLRPDRLEALQKWLNGTGDQPPADNECHGDTFYTKMHCWLNTTEGMIWGAVAGTLLLGTVIAGSVLVGRLRQKRRQEETSQVGRVPPGLPGSPSGSKIYKMPDATKYAPSALEADEIFKALSEDPGAKARGSVMQDEEIHALAGAMTLGNRRRLSAEEKRELRGKGDHYMPSSGKLAGEDVWLPGGPGVDEHQRDLTRSLKREGHTSVAPALGRSDGPQVWLGSGDARGDDATAKYGSGRPDYSAPEPTQQKIRKRKSASSMHFVPRENDTASWAGAISSLEAGRGERMASYGTAGRARASMPGTHYRVPDGDDPWANEMEQLRRHSSPGNRSARSYREGKHSDLEDTYGEEDSGLPVPSYAARERNYRASSDFRVAEGDDWTSARAQLERHARGGNGTGRRSAHSAVDVHGPLDDDMLSGHTDISDAWENPLNTTNPLFCGGDMGHIYEGDDGGGDLYGQLPSAVQNFAPGNGDDYEGYLDAVPRQADHNWEHNPDAYEPGYLPTPGGWNTEDPYLAIAGQESWESVQAQGSQWAQGAAGGRARNIYEGDADDPYLQIDGGAGWDGGSPEVDSDWTTLNESESNANLRLRGAPTFNVGNLPTF
jgi:hypothetical protein